MKIVHLATSITGGAGIAALRSHRALLTNGIDSTILTNSYNASNDNDIVSVSPNFVKDFVSSALTLVQQKVVQKTSDLVTPMSISKKVTLTKEFSTADVVHIHAFYNLLNIRDFQEILSSDKKVFVTLHDERVFTGGCHYTRDCDKFISICDGCPQSRVISNALIVRSQQKLIQTFSNRNRVRFVAPSKWIKDEALKSTVLAGSQISVVRNPVPEIFFKIRKIADEGNKNVGVFRIGFISQNIDNPYKGIDTLISSIRNISSDTTMKIELHLIGNKSKTYTLRNVEVINQHITNDYDMAHKISNMNLVVLPSSQDNFPSVIGETLATGTRLIGSKVGGIAEALAKYSLPVFDHSDSNSLTKLIEAEIADERMSVDRNEVRSEFSEQAYANKILELYSS